MAKILIVDDEKEMRDISSQILSIEGYEVDTAADAKSALFKLKNNRYEYLLVDLVLPGRMNGIDIIKNVRHLSSDIFIVAYSGFSGVDIAEKVIHAGANNFITKPFQRQQLLDVVNNSTEVSKVQQSCFY